MSSYATVHIADGREVCSFRNGVDQLFFILFTAREAFAARGSAAYEIVRASYVDLDPENARVTGFRTTAQAIRERLDLLGITEQLLSETLDGIVRDQVSFYTKQLDRSTLGDVLDMHYRNEIDALQRVTWSTWLEAVGGFISSGDPLRTWDQRPDVGTFGWFSRLWEDYDQRYSFGAILHALGPNEEITMDLSQLDEDWVEASADPQGFARDMVLYATTGGLPPIVLTEGTFDAEVLAAAIRVRRPHLVEYIRLPDFAHDPGGGADALRQTLRAFAAAGIPNRVVGLFDNDAAGRVAAAPLGSSLPSNIAYTFLPDLLLARQYPTLGPQGRTVMDVNQLACSIEMYLGTDVLNTAGRSLRPIVWNSFFKKASVYQGTIDEKDEVQRLWRKKVELAERRPSAVESQDWSGLDLVLDHLLVTIQSVQPLAG